MKTHREAGFGTVGIIAVVAVVAIGGYFVLNSGSSSTAPVTSESGSVTDPIAEAESVVADAVANVDEALEATMEKDDMMDDKEMMDKADEMDDTAKSNEMMDKAEETVAESAPAAAAPATTASAPGTFEDYSPEKLALANGGDVVLFFHASWCPSCRGLENDINANLSNIPANTHILKLDYDTETDLKKEYGVVRQHTLIQVDANGEVVKRLTGLTNTLAQVTGQLN